MSSTSIKVERKSSKLLRKSSSNNTSSRPQSEAGAQTEASESDTEDLENRWDEETRIHPIFDTWDMIISIVALIYILLLPFYTSFYPKHLIGQILVKIYLGLTEIFYTVDVFILIIRPVKLEAR